MLARYLQYLHADIRQAVRRPEEVAPMPSGPDFWLTEVHNLVIEAPNITFGERCGLMAEAFPPAHRLNVHQVSRLCMALNGLYRSWRLDLFLPECVPAEAAYPALVSVLEKKLPIATCGWVVVDFCEEGKGCPFGKHCFCREGEHPCSQISPEPGRDEWY